MISNTQDADLTYNQEKHLQLMHENADHYFFNEEYENALQKYEEILKINPGDSKAWHNLGAAFFALGEYEDAIRSFSRSLKINLNPDTLFMKASALKNIGQIIDAVACYDTALNLEMDDQLSNETKRMRKILLDELSVEQKSFYYRKYFNSPFHNEKHE
jgi:tetratricopeptide (TPR) repeat protein